MSFDDAQPRIAFIGIDPGVAGGLALLRADGVVVAVEKMPSTDRDKLDLLRSWTKCYLPSAAIEFVRSSPQMGVASSFKFGWGYGALLMALAACEIPYEQVTPGVWQRSMKCLSKGDKNVTKAMAQQLFPELSKITHATADALLIAEYFRRLRG